MPHAVSPEASPAQADAVMDEAVSSPPAIAAVETTTTAAVKIEPPSSPPGLTTDDADTDMADVPEATPTAKPGATPAAPMNLDDLFDDEDDEFPSSAPGYGADAISTSDMLSLPASDPAVMRSFYQRLFPWRYLFQWLNHSPTPTNDFAHREFAFTLQNDAYLRYQAFPNSDL